MDLNRYHSFIAAIRAEPDDDALRLIAADWLDEQCEVHRAEFIRIGLKLARPEMQVCACFPSRWPRRQYECERCVLANRQYTILSSRRHDEESLSNGDVWGCLLHNAIADDFSRGFMETAKYTCQQWLEHGKEIYLAHPLRQVVLTDKHPYSDFGQRFCWWYFPTDWRLAEQDSIPATIFGRLVGKRSPVRSDRMRVYDTEATAIADLSQACLAWTANH